MNRKLLYKIVIGIVIFGFLSLMVNDYLQSQIKKRTLSSILPTADKLHPDRFFWVKEVTTHRFVSSIDSAAAAASADKWIAGPDSTAINYAYGRAEYLSHGYPYRMKIRKIWLQQDEVLLSTADSPRVQIFKGDGSLAGSQACSLIYGFIGVDDTLHEATLVDTPAAYQDSSLIVDTYDKFAVIVTEKDSPYTAPTTFYPDTIKGLNITIEFEIIE